MNAETKTMAQTAEFFTREYEFAHGRMPRGRGGWAFSFTPRDGTVPPQKDVFNATFNGTYAEAKKGARAYARATFHDASHVDITVCS